MYVPNQTARDSVPWVFDSPGGDAQHLRYTWSSRPGADPLNSFEAVIECDRGWWSWRVLASGGTIELGSGRGADLDECEETVLETVGKSFLSSTPHGGLATPASRRYTLAGGTRRDLADHQGQWVRLFLIDGQDLIGLLETGNWQLIVQIKDGSRLQVPPEAILTIERV